MSGTCDGGFLWLGEYKGSEGGMFSSPSMKTSNLQTDGQLKEMLLQTKNKLGASPWAPEMDHPTPNAPLPPGQ